MAKNTVSPEKTALLNAFSDFLDTLATSGASGGSVAKVVAESESGGLDKEAVSKLGIVELRALAKQNGVELKKKADILDALEEKGVFAESEEEEEDDDDEVEVEDDEDEADEDEEGEEDDEEENDDEDSLSREDLEEMSLKELRVLAKEQGIAQADYRSLDQAALVDLLLGEDEDEEDDEDVEDEEDEVEITPESLKAMSETELRSLAKDAGITISKTAKKSAIVKTILAAVEDDEDEDDE